MQTDKIEVCNSTTGYEPFLYTWISTEALFCLFYGGHHFLFFCTVHCDTIM
jgi:hypothetical protein